MSEESYNYKMWTYLFLFYSVHTWDILPLSGTENFLLYFFLQCISVFREQYSPFSTATLHIPITHRRDSASSKCNVSVKTNSFCNTTGIISVLTPIIYMKSWYASVPLIILFIFSSYQYPSAKEELMAWLKLCQPPSASLTAYHRAELNTRALLKQD